MSRAAGILTSRGGLASHAAVVARGWGIPAVVGAEGVEVGDGEIRIDGRALRVGDVITIDGGTGEVFEGIVAGTTEVVPEVATLVGWAREAGVDVGDTDTAPSPTAPSQASVEVDADRALRAISIKGFVTAEGVADAVVATPVDVQPVLDGLVADGLVESTSGAYRLTAAGHERAVRSSRRSATRGVSRLRRRARCLPRYRPSREGGRHRWQMRDGGVNDHADADYDADVLERLATIHVDAMAWLAPLEPTLPRLGDYRAAYPGTGGGPVGRRPLRGLTPGRQLPRHLVRAPRGPDPARGPHARGGNHRRPRMNAGAPGGMTGPCAGSAAP